MEKNPDKAPLVHETEPMTLVPDNAPPPKSKKAEADEKRHKRRMQALRSFLFRLFALLLVIYVLLFHIVGIALMPNRDM